MEQEKHQHYKRYKGDQKDFYRFVVTEIEDFFPEIPFEDPLKKYKHQLNSLPITVSGPARKKLTISKTPKVLNSTQTTIKHGPNFNIFKYWKQFSSAFNQNLMRFMDLKDIVSLIYTCQYFRETIDQESTWKTLQVRDFFTKGLKFIKPESKERLSMKQYYRFLYLSQVSGIPHHTGYFKAYGSPDLAELSIAMVDFLCPRTEVIKKYAGEILMRNQCQTFDMKLSWLREKKEICLWNGNSSIDFRKPEVGNEEVEQLNEFYPCFMKKYAMVDEDEEIVGAFFLEDRYLVVKLVRKDEAENDHPFTEVIFRTLDLEDEFHSMAKGLDPVVPFDYTWTLKKENGRKDVEVKSDEFGVEFEIYQEGKLNIKIELLQDHKAVFFTPNSEKPTMIFWDLKEKKQIGSTVFLELKKPLNSIIKSKKTTRDDKLRVVILDEGMNVYIGNLSKEEGFVIHQTILIPEVPEEKKPEDPEEEVEEENKEKKASAVDAETLKEMESKFNLTFGKKTRMKNYRSQYYTHMFNGPHRFVKELDQNFEDKTRRYYHGIFENVEWLIVHQANCFYFVNLDEEKLYEFSSVRDIGEFCAGNWTIYEDYLLVTIPSNIFYCKINFQEKTIRFVFSRDFRNLEVEKVVKEWLVIDPCFTVLILAHDRNLGIATRATVIVTSTQEFLYEIRNEFPLVFYKVQADRLIHVPDRWENKSRDLNIKFENSKVFVSSKKGGFFFDMTLSTLPYNNVYLNGWVSKDPVAMIQFMKPVVKVEETEVETEEQGEEEKIVKAKFVNKMRLEGNPNTANAKEKSNGWKKSGKSQAKKEEHREEKVVKGKGDKYHKNIRQGQRSDKMN